MATTVVLGARAEGRFRFQKHVSIKPSEVWGLTVDMRVRRGLTSSAFVGMTFTGKPEWEYDSPGSGGLTPAFTLDRLGSFVNAGLCLSY